MEIDSQDLTPKQCSILTRQAMQRRQPGMAYAMTAMRSILLANARKMEPVAKLRHYLNAWEAIEAGMKCDDNRDVVENLKDQFVLQMRVAVESIIAKTDSQYRERLAEKQTKGAQHRIAVTAEKRLELLSELCRNLPVADGFDGRVKRIVSDWSDQIALLSSTAPEQPGENAAGLGDRLRRLNERQLAHLSERVGVADAHRKDHAALLNELHSLEEHDGRVSKVLGRWERWNASSLGPTLKFCRDTEVYEVVMGNGDVEGFAVRRHAEDFAMAFGWHGEIEQGGSKPPAVVIPGHTPSPTKLPTRLKYPGSHPVAQQREEWTREVDEWYATQRDIMLGVRGGTSECQSLDELEGLYRAKLSEIAHVCEQVMLSAPAIGEAFPFAEYATRADWHVRDNHAAFHGLIAPTSWPGWKIMRPPNGLGCRCYLIFRTQEQADALGLKPGEVRWPSQRARDLFESGQFPDEGFRGPKPVAAEIGTIDDGQAGP